MGPHSSHITAEKVVMDSALSPGDCLLGLQQLKEQKPVGGPQATEQGAQGRRRPLRGLLGWQGLSVLKLVSNPTLLQQKHDS